MCILMEMKSIILKKACLLFQRTLVSALKHLEFVNASDDSGKEAISITVSTRDILMSKLILVSFKLKY